MENKIIKIHSHPRSGTNYLGSLLKLNFYNNIDLKTQGKWGHWSNRLDFNQPVMYGRLFGDHSFNLINNKTPKIYIYRDGRSVALSVWKSYNFNNKNIENMCFSDYLRHKIDWEGSPGVKSKPKNNIIEHWLRHVNVWHKYSINNGMMLVRYEELFTKTEKVLNDIANFYDLKFNDDFKNMDELVGPSPNKANIYEWKNYFNKEDEEYFFSIIKDNNNFLYNENVDIT
jgi:hypothetical protein